MADKKYVIKGFGCIFPEGPSDAYIMLRPDINPNAHERVPELNDRVTRFDTHEAAEDLAERRISNVFESYVIEEAEAVETTNTEEEGE